MLVGLLVPGLGTASIWAGAYFSAEAEARSRSRRLEPKPKPAAGGGQFDAGLVDASFDLASEVRKSWNVSRRDVACGRDGLFTR